MASTPPVQVRSNGVGGSQRPILRRAVSVAGKSAEWIVPLVLLAASIPPILIRRQSLTVIPWLNIIDGSLILDTCYKAAHGVWFGRDVAMTRGPLYQWLSSAPSRLIGPSLGSIYATSATLSFILIVVAAFAIARLLLPAAAAWRRAAFVLLAVVFWSASELRTLFPVLALAMFLRFTDPMPDHIGPLVRRAVAAAIICITGFLFSPDTGLYTVAALLLCSAATAIVYGGTLRAAKFLLLAVFSSAIGVVLTNSLMGAPLNFRLWQSSLALISSYRWFVPLPLDRADTRLIFGTLLLGVAAFGAAWLWRNPQGSTPDRATDDRDGGTASWTRRPGFLLAGFALGLLMMQSGLVRSDHPHVAVGIGPMLVLCGLIAFDEPGSGRLLRLALPTLAVVLTLVFAHADVQFLPGYVFTQARNIVKPVLACPNGWEEFDQACIPRVQADVFGMISRYVDRNVGPQKPIVVFPYETVVGLISHRQVASGVMQSYLVDDDYLTGLELEALQRRRPLFGLYFPDGILGSALDSVPSFTRSPGLWFYLVGHYRGDISPFPGSAGLVSDDTRAARLRLSGENIADPLGPVAVGGQGISLPIGPVRWPAGGVDFVRLRLRVDYPFWWRIRKPSKLILKLSFEGGSEKAIPFVVPPDQTSDAWFFPWDDRAMIGYFSSNPALWKLGARPPVAGLTLMVEPFDWASVLPNSITVQSVEAIRFGMQ